MADINTKEIAQALMHAGISGQKWYQRRYQNPDGTYTELGKIRKRAYYKDNYAGYSNDDLKAMTERNNAINAYEKSVSERGLAQNNARTTRYGNASKRAASVSSGVKSAAAIITGSVAVVAAGAAFAKAFSSGGQGRKDAKTVAMFVSNGMKRVKELFSVKHSEIDEDYLAHHGILGQKWGIRRFQNDDGTLTPLGRKRYGVKTYNELSASQKRDIEKRDAELRTRQETDYQNKMLAKQQKREYKLEKQKLKNEAAENKSAERVEKAEIESAREERLQAETNEKAQKTVKAIAIGLAATTTVLGLAVARKTGVFSKGTAPTSSSGNRPKVDIGSKGRDAESRFNVLKGLFSKTKNSGAGKSAGESVKAAFVKAKDVPKAARTSAGKTVFETFRDSDGLFKSAADILRNHPGQLRLTTP